MGFSMQEYGCLLSFPPLGDLWDIGSNPHFLCVLHWQADSLPLICLRSPNSKSIICKTYNIIYRKNQDRFREWGRGKERWGSSFLIFFFPEKSSIAHSTPWSTKLNVMTQKPLYQPHTAGVDIYIRSKILKKSTRLKHAAATAKSLQSCPTLCDPIDGSPPGSPVPGIL